MGNPDYSKSLSTVKMLHWSLVLMLVGFGVVVFLLNISEPTGEVTDDNNILLYVPAIVLVIAIPTSMIVFKKHIKENMPKKPTKLSDKLGLYQTGHLIRMAILEVAGFFAVVISLITGTLLNLAVLLIAILFMVMLTPSLLKITEAVDLTPKERNQLAS